PVEIEFGKPNVPEGSELPTGKATQTVTGETMTRPALLTTSEVAGAKIAPVDMVMAVASVDSPAEVADAMAAVLEELRDKCTEAGGDVVTGVKTEISSAGSLIMVTAAGTAVSLL
ncbi:MAG: heavy metal-binding domain-containing protein, partial [Acidimicrobiia bacterium]|nr:heavy metal-binding domain-containing protein [Acidimicrobiia bacterium]